MSDEFCPRCLGSGFVAPMASFIQGASSQQPGYASVNGTLPCPECDEEDDE